MFINSRKFIVEEKAPVVPERYLEPQAAADIANEKCPIEWIAPLRSQKTRPTPYEMIESRCKSAESVKDTRGCARVDRRSGCAYSCSGGENGFRLATGRFYAEGKPFCAEGKRFCAYEKIKGN